MRNSIDRESLRTLVADAIDIDVSELTDTADFRDDLEVDSLSRPPRAQSRALR